MEDFDGLLDLGAAFARAVCAADAPPAGAGAPPPGAPYVVNRRGERVAVCFDKITARNTRLATDPRYGPPLGADLCGATTTAAVVGGFRPGMTTRELDYLTVQALGSDSHDPRSHQLAARICVDDIHKRTPEAPGEMAAAILAAAPDRRSARLSDDLLLALERGREEIEARFRPARDFRLGNFGLQTLAQSYLIRPRGREKVACTLLEDALHERPGHLYLRVALGIFVGAAARAGEGEFRARLADALRFYDALSCHLVSNATPSMANAGTLFPQMSSCFQLAAADDLGALFGAVAASAAISKWMGGISIWLHSVRAETSRIRSTGGESKGILPYIQLLEKTQVYADQGGNRRGAFACYLGVDHADLGAFLAAPRLKGKEALLGETAPQLKYALWVSDLFMEALEADLAAEEEGRSGTVAWHLFCPDEAPGLHLAYGDEYRELYARYVREGRARRTVSPRWVIEEAFKSWAQVGVPYVLFKDHINRKSNMRNVAPICSSNLCVAGDTLVLTDRGHVPIASLAAAARPVRVWNGAEWSEVTPVQTSEAAELVRVTLDDGAVVDCTPYHKFYVTGASRAASREIRAGALAPGDPLEKAEAMPVVEGGDDFPDAYTNGFFTADGHVAKATARCLNPAPRDGRVCWHHLDLEPEWPDDGQCGATIAGINMVNLYGAKIDLIPHLALHATRPGEYVSEVKTVVRLTDALMPKFYVPHGTSVASRLEWLAGLCDGDATIVRQKGSFSLQLSSIKLEFLRSVRLLLQTLGCRPCIKTMHEAGRREIKEAEYDCKKSHRLLICAWDLNVLVDLGFAPRRLDLGGRLIPTKDLRRYVKVVSVEPLPGLHPTFCFTEPKRHRGIFNGILGGNCSEITIPSWSEYDAAAFGAFHEGNAAGGETGVCNLAAVCLESFVVVEEGVPRLDFEGVAGAAALEVQALNRVIDGTFYPTPECARSNRRHRPVGVGIMGLADVLARLGLAYGGPGALALARGVAAALYYGALSESCRLAEADGPYATFAGSPASEGRLAPDLWAEAGHLAPGWEAEVAAATGGWLRPEHWAALRRRAAAGLRNAYVTAYMPTASTSNIVGQNECFEPFTSNIYVRKTQAGEFLLVNKHLVAALEARGLWTADLRRRVIAAGGSVAGLGLPADIQDLFQTARELHPTRTIRTAAAMAPFVCQSMSMNLFLDAPSLPKINRFLLEGWRAGLKTGLYYCHTAPAAAAQQSSVRAPGVRGAPAPAPTPAPAPEPAPESAPTPAPAPESAPTPAPEPEGPVCYRGCASCGV